MPSCQNSLSSSSDLMKASILRTCLGIYQNLAVFVLFKIWKAVAFVIQYRKVFVIISPSDKFKALIARYKKSIFVEPSACAGLPGWIPEQASRGVLVYGSAGRSVGAGARSGRGPIRRRDVLLQPRREAVQLGAALDCEVVTDVAREDFQDLVFFAELVELRLEPQQGLNHCGGLDVFLQPTQKIRADLATSPRR